MRGKTISNGDRCGSVIVVVVFGGGGRALLSNCS